MKSDSHLRAMIHATQFTIWSQNGNNECQDCLLYSANTQCSITMSYGKQSVCHIEWNHNGGIPVQNWPQCGLPVSISWCLDLQPMWLPRRSHVNANWRCISRQKLTGSNPDESLHPWHAEKQWLGCCLHTELGDCPPTAPMPAPTAFSDVWPTNHGLQNQSHPLSTNH
jgi:hypothetical protein